MSDGPKGIYNPIERCSLTLSQRSLPNELPDDGQLVDLLADEERRLRIAEALDRCLERLPEPQRRSIRLFFFDRCSYADIAAATSWHLKSVRSYIQNGKRNLKICLEKNRP